MARAPTFMPYEPFLLGVRVVFNILSVQLQVESPQLQVESPAFLRSQGAIAEHFCKKGQERVFNRRDQWQSLAVFSTQQGIATYFQRKITGDCSGPR